MHTHRRQVLQPRMAAQHIKLLIYYCMSTFMYVDVHVLFACMCMHIHVEAGGRPRLLLLRWRQPLWRLGFLPPWDSPSRPVWLDLLIDFTKQAQESTICGPEDPQVSPNLPRYALSASPAPKLPESVRRPHRRKRMTAAASSQGTSPLWARTSVSEWCPLTLGTARPLSHSFYLQ